MRLPGRRSARWSVRRAPVAAFSAAVLAWGSPGVARALEDGREPIPRAAAPDQLAGQLVLRGGAEIVGPVGSLSEDVAVDDVAATGIGAFASVGLGLSRTTELVLSGGYAVLSDPAR